MSRQSMGLGARPLTPMAKKLIIINVALWFGFILVFQKFFMDQPSFFMWFGLIPERMVNGFWIWQPFTYMFLHSYSVFHVAFNMLILWWLGGDLEERWGSKFFLTYYLVCGIGAGLLYVFGMTIYYLASGNFMVMTIPVIGASGAVFGLMLAYGIIFAERTIYFMMIFPMKAKFFILLLGAFEIVTILSEGGQNGVANLAHLGGIVVGFLFLRFWGKWSAKLGKGRKRKKRGPKLRLVVDNERKFEDKDDADGPKYWN